MIRKQHNNTSIQYALILFSLLLFLHQILLINNNFMILNKYEFDNCYLEYLQTGAISIIIDISLIIIGNWAYFRNDCKWARNSIKIMICMLVVLIIKIFVI